MLSDEPDRLPILGSGLSCARALPAGLSGPSPSSAGPVGRKDWKSNAAASPTEGEGEQAPY